MLLYTNYTKGIRVKLFPERCTNNREVETIIHRLIKLSYSAAVTDDVEIRQNDYIFLTVAEIVCYLRFLQITQFFNTDTDIEKGE